MIRTARAKECPLCGGPLNEALRWNAPPPGETQFELSQGSTYEREFRRCARCGHFLAVSDMNLSALYGGAYVDATYSSGEGMRAAYERIMALPANDSDNLQRVERIVGFAGEGNGSGGARTVLDVGSGLGVFPARMKERGWTVTALDPDARAVEHARETIGVEAVRADFMDVQDLSPFDLVTFNKVLEHVVDPVAMLERTHPLLRTEGLVYVEVPDGEAAAAAPEGGELREEFFIEHLHCFSATSLTLLAAAAGFRVESLERLREPSGKYTLAAFLEAASR